LLGKAKTVNNQKANKREWKKKKERNFEERGRKQAVTSASYKTKL